MSRALLEWNSLGPRLVEFGMATHWSLRCIMPFLIVLVAGADSANAQEKASTTLLQIGITHSERLPELPPDQQVGQVFDGFEPPPLPSQKAQQAITQTKQSAQQSVKTAPLRIDPRSGLGAWQNNASAIKPTPKVMPPKMAPGYVKPPQQHRPSQAEIQAALKAYASYRNPRGVPPPTVLQPQSLMPQSGMLGATVNRQSQNMLNGSASSGQAYAGGSKNSGIAKAPSQIRFKIPAWMAGVWQRSDSNELRRVSLPSGKQLKAAGHNIARVKDTFGTYRDQNGQIWQVFDPLHATVTIDRGPEIDYHSVTAYNIIVSGSDAPVVAVRATHVIVSKSTHRVVSSFQDEEMNTYSKTLDGRLRTESSVKVFDAKGRPQLLTTALSMETQIAPFSGPVR
jgi:hypothetical protein